MPEQRPDQSNIVEQQREELLRTPRQQQVYGAIQARFMHEVPSNRNEVINRVAPSILRNAAKLFRTGVDIENGEHLEFSHPADVACVYVGSLMKQRVDARKPLSFEDSARCIGSFEHAERVMGERGESGQQYQDICLLAESVPLINDIHIWLANQQGTSELSNIL